MDQTISLPDPTPSSPRPVGANPVAVAAGLQSDEEPESPGRSPVGDSTAPLSDPLSDGLAFLAGAAIALAAVLVPVLTVISGPRPVAPVQAEPVRTVSTGS